MHTLTRTLGFLLVFLGGGLLWVWSLPPGTLLNEKLHEYQIYSIWDGTRPNQFQQTVWTDYPIRVVLSGPVLGGFNQRTASSTFEIGVQERIDEGRIIETKQTVIMRGRDPIIRPRITQAKALPRIWSRRSNGLLLEARLVEENGLRLTAMMATVYGRAISLPSNTHFIGASLALLGFLMMVLPTFIALSRRRKVARRHRNPADWGR